MSRREYRRKESERENEGKQGRKINKHVQMRVWEESSMGFDGKKTRQREEFIGRGRECEEAVRGGRRFRWCEAVNVGRGQERDRQKVDKKRRARRKDGRVK